MNRIDLLNFSEFGKASDLETLLKKEEPMDKLSLGSALLKCIEVKDFTQEHMKVVNLLVSHGADVNFKNEKFVSCLMMGCMNGNFDVIQVLLENGANAKDLDRQMRTTVILVLTFNASDPLEAVKLLHEKGASVTAKDLAGSTALHMAAFNGHKDSLEYLVSSQVNINAQDTNNDTPLHLAFRKDRKQCIDILIKLADTSLKNLRGKTPLEEAHGKSLAVWSSKKFNKDEINDNRRGRGKPRGKNFKKKEKEFGECLKCRQIAEVYCLDCSSEIINVNNEELENIERKNLLEAKECLRLAQLKIKELEKELAEAKEPFGSSNYNIKIKKTPLYLKPSKEKPYEQCKDQLQNDINSFVKDQERWRSKIDLCYREAISVFTAVITDTFKNSAVDIFGSFATGLMLPYSDIDIVIQNVTLPTLNALKELIPKIDTLSIVKKSDKIFTATIPLLKVYSELKGQEVKLDITIQEPKHRGLECTILVKKFLSSYSTIKHVFLVLKQLMFFCNFHEPYKGGISSYGLFLMLVYFYQENINEWNIVNAEKQRNEAEVLIRFLEYFSNGFNYSKYIVVDYENWDNKEYKNRTVIIT